MAMDSVGPLVDQALLRAESATSLGGTLSMVPQAQNITVNRDNVLQAAKIIQDLLFNEGKHIVSLFDRLEIIPPGEDPVSIQAARAWTAKLRTNDDSYQNRVEEYLQSLATLVANLKAAALQYGYTDQQIADAFPAGTTSA
jgi:hypothetical protein